LAAMALNHFNAVALAEIKFFVDYFEIMEAS
jgi:hypothetical protein